MSQHVILCVDDEPGILKSLDRCLTLDNYEVIQAPGGDEALRILEERSGQVSLIIVDQRMPTMMGDEFLKKVRVKYGPIKAIMLSGYADFAGLVSAVNEGQIFHLIQKPWDNKELLKIVRTTIFPEQTGS